MIIINHGSTIVREGQWVTIPDDAIFTRQNNWGTFLKEHEIVKAELKRW